MFTRFEKAEARRARRSGGMMLSVAAHAALVWLAAVATVRGNEPPLPEPPPPLVYLPPRPEPQPLPEATPGTTSPSPSGAAVARGPRPPVRIIDAPPFVPPELPPIADGAPSALDDAVEIGREAIGAGPAAGSASGSGLPGAGGVWSGPMVEVEARARPGNPAPRYPAVLEQSGVGGRVLVRFVVDTSGRIERGSVEVVASDEALFTAAVRRALAGYRFEPARVSGRPVRQLVELPFVFAARR